MTYDILILGSGAAGLTAAIYAARAGLTFAVVEGMEPGGQLTITSDVENYPGFQDPVAGPELMASMRAQAQRFGTQFIAGDMTDADVSRRPFVISAAGKSFESRALIIATGASAKWLGLEAEAKLRGKGVSSCAVCDGFFFRGKEVAVIGGGDTAIEEATFLARFASKVTVVHRRDQLRASKAMQDRAKNDPRIEFAWNSVVEDILDVSKGAVTGLVLKDTRSGRRLKLACEGAFIAIGHRPNTDIFRGKLDMDELGYIITQKSSMATSVPGVFAAGDCQDRIYRQAVTAAGTGCMAALDAQRYLEQAR